MYEEFKQHVLPSSQKKHDPKKTRWLSKSPWLSQWHARMDWSGTHDRWSPRKSEKGTSAVSQISKPSTVSIYFPCLMDGFCLSIICRFIHLQYVLLWLQCVPACCMDGQMRGWADWFIQRQNTSPLRWVAWFVYERICQLYENMDSTNLKRLWAIMWVQEQHHPHDFLMILRLPIKHWCLPSNVQAKTSRPRGCWAIVGRIQLIKSYSTTIFQGWPRCFGTFRLSGIIAIWNLAIIAFWNQTFPMKISHTWC